MLRNVTEKFLIFVDEWDFQKKSIEFSKYCAALKIARSSINIAQVIYKKFFIRTVKHRLAQQLGNGPVLSYLVTRNSIENSLKPFADLYRNC